MNTSPELMDPTVEGLVGPLKSLQVSNECTGTEPLTDEEHGNPQECSASTDSSEMHALICTSETPIPQVSPGSYSKASIKPQSNSPASTTANNADVGNYQGDSGGSPNECKSTTVPSVITELFPKTKEECILQTLKFKSLVFFDLETTGLAFEIGASNVQIAEISMIAMSMKDFEQSSFEDFRDIRIIQKLCLCTRPRSLMSSSAAAINGLSNEDLRDQNPFDASAALAINCFLSRLPKPACLLAHNGNSYDFPLLKAELSRLNMSLPPDIFIADTLKAFRALEVPVFPPEKVCKSVKYTKSGKISCALSNLYLYFFNENPAGSHSSEGDCIALAKLCHRMKDSMLLWIGEHYTTFDSISPMW